MNMYTNTKKSKKFILILVLLLLFNFLWPKNIKAGFGEDITAAPAKIFWMIEEGVMIFLNNLFVNPDNEVSTVSEIKLTPENIIKGKFILFDANIFKEIKNDANYLDYVQGGSVSEGKIALRDTISGWYYALRNFAIVALLSVLVYVGIRMILSTIAQDKAKYKVMFKDWLIALCLVVIMHYLMIGILNISSMVVDALGGGQNSNMISDLTKDITYILSDDHRNSDNEPYTYEDMTLSDAYAKILVFGGIIAYTFIFAVKYLKREFTIIFLVLLGPVSCITYPIDKISDGKAQAFNKWFSEFLYQVIIQPFHLLLYIVLIGSATQLADANVIYAIICFAVMIPAEKFVKEMFGFKDKLGSPLGAMATGAAAGQIFNKLRSGGSSGSSGKNSGGQDSGSSELPVKTKEADLPGENSDNTYVSQDEVQRLGSGQEAGESMDQVVASGTTAEVMEENNQDNNQLSAAEQMDDAQGQNELARQTTDAIDKGEEKREEKEEEKEKQGLLDKVKNNKGVAAVRDKYNRNLLRKYGTVDRKELAKKRAWRAAKGVGKLGGRTIKKAVTLAGALAGATALGLAGAMVGQGSKGAVAGAALGAGLGNSLGKQGDKIASKSGDYIGTFYNAAAGKDTNKDKYMKDQNNIDMARRNFKERNGYRGSGEEIQEELENMYYMKEHGVQDSQMEDTMNEYHENIKEIKDGGKGMNDIEGRNTAIQSALMAQDYTKKDFNDPKKMQEAYDGLLKRYEAAGITGDKADEHIRNIMSGAGAMKGVSKIALPPKTIELSPEQIRRNGAIERLNSRGVSEPTETQISQEVTLHQKLLDNGFDESQQKELSNMASDNRSYRKLVNTVINIKQDYEAGNENGRNIEKIVGKNAETKEVTEEIIEQYKIEKEMGVAKQNVADVRAVELDYAKGDSNKIKEVRKLGNKALKNGGKLSEKDKLSVSKDANALAEMYVEGQVTNL